MQKFENTTRKKGLVDFKLGIINAISAADIAFIISTSHATIYWLNAFDILDITQTISWLTIALVARVRFKVC